MRILLISDDNLLQSTVKNFGENTQASTSAYNTDPKPIKVLSSFLSRQPSVLIVDDACVIRSFIKQQKPSRAVHNLIIEITIQ